MILSTLECALFNNIIYIDTKNFFYRTAIIETSNETIYIQEIDGTSSLVMNVRNLTKEECGLMCSKTLNCVYSFFEENNCTFGTDATYDFDVKYSFNISSTFRTDIATYIKSPNRGNFLNDKRHLILIYCRLFKYEKYIRN